MQDIDIALGVIIFLLLCSIALTIYFIITKDLKQEPCPECKPCTQAFTLKQEPPVVVPPTSSLAPGGGRKRCRYDQDTKNVFSSFHKHNCGKTPYAKVK
jgi:hypothetical protein